MVATEGLAHIIETDLYKLIKCNELGFWLVLHANAHSAYFIPLKSQRF